MVSQDTTADEILLMNPDGVMLSNGPGDPQDVKRCFRINQWFTGESSNLRNLFRSPVNWFGLWSKTYKLKFGHRGGNHPVLDLKQEK